MLRIPGIARALTLLALLAGCASTPEAGRQSDAEAKQFETGGRSAIIYIYRRDNPSLGGVATIWVDGRLVGQSVPSTYFRVFARPGRNRITASGNDMGRLDIDTRGGEIYFVSMNVLGEGEGSSNTIFLSVTPEAGKTAILHCCTLLETWQPGQQRFNFLRSRD